MPRPKSECPALRPHISGKAICTIGGVDFYLGKYGSPESLAKYAYLIREYQSNNLTLPKGFNLESLESLSEGFDRPHIKVDQEKVPNTVGVVTAAYREYVKERFAHNDSERKRLLKVCDDLDSQAKELPAKDYGSKMLLAFRDSVVKRGVSRMYANRLTNAVTRIFKWAEPRELVPTDAYVRLTTVEPLRVGESKAVDNPPVEPVDLVIVRKTLLHLPPNLRAVIAVQLATGARPSEVLNMRPCDIDRSQSVWMYRPVKHKNSSKGKHRSIPIINEAREAVIDYLNRPKTAYMFSPKEGEAWWNAKARSERKSKVQPSQVDRSDPSRTGRKPGDRYDAHSYRRAIHRACKKAGVPNWFPYQLRHCTATELNMVLGPESARDLLGHTTIGTTRRYIQTKEAAAIAAAQAAPRLNSTENQA